MPRVLTIRLAAASFALALIALLVGVDEFRAAADPPFPPPPQRLVVDWAPADGARAKVLTDPGPGGTRTVRVGDRVHLPPSPDFGGLRLQRWDGLLVPYGTKSTYLAVAPGQVVVENTVYDENRPCVPPQPVSTFRLVIAEGPRLAIPPAKQVYPSDAGRTIELVPGQQVLAARGLGLSARDSGTDVLRETTWGTYAVRPGTATVVIADRPRNQDKQVEYEITVRVIAPGAARAPAPEGAAAPMSGPVGLLAAAAAPAPMCG